MSENLATQEEGEAAESDEEDQSQVSFMPNTMVCSTMVSGEASETDDEDEDVQHSVKFSDDGIHADAKADPPDEHEGEDLHHTKPDLQKPRKQKIVYKFDSPFHRKLRERNLALRSDLVEGVMNTYKAAAAKLNSSTFHLTRAQEHALDVAENTRFMVEDLDTLCKQLELVSSSEFLPFLHTPTSQE